MPEIPRRVVAQRIAYLHRLITDITSAEHLLQGHYDRLQNYFDNNPPQAFEVQEEHDYLLYTNAQLKVKVILELEQLKQKLNGQSEIDTDPKLVAVNDNQD
jgi:hypothetical protein